TADVSFYDGCLIVQVYTYGTTTASKGPAEPVPASNDHSIHRWSPYVTPSSYAPYPNEARQEHQRAPPHGLIKQQDAKGHDKENIPAQDGQA
ncbi:SPT20 family protein, partial [Escherichia coli]|nr:SPT20 family protein [Escherichia coli]